VALEQTLITILLWFGVYAIVAISLNIEYGYGGIPNFGRAFAILIGALAVGAIVNRIFIALTGVSGVTYSAASGFAKSKIDALISSNPAYGILILLFCVALAAILGAIFGAIFILPSAKLKSDYLAITLLAISEVSFIVSYYNTEIVGGYYGTPTPNVLAFIPGESREIAYTILMLIFAALIFLLAERLMNSPYGRLLKAMREDEDVVESFGKDVMKIRIKTVALGSSLAAIVGALYTLYAGNVSGVVNLFARVNWTFYPFLMVLLGGMANNRGVLAGTFLFVAVWRLLDQYKHEIAAVLNLPFDVNWLQYIIFGALMILVLYYRPEGLIKEQPIRTEPIKEIKSGKKV